MPMRYLFAAALVAAAALAGPAAALTPEEKMETCKIGADAQKLTGTKRKKFLTRCMADTDGGAKGK
jgi:entry exclusion lipoprotein TrbK